MRIIPGGRQSQTSAGGAGETKICVVWVAINERGEYVVGPDQDYVGEIMDTDFGGAFRALHKLVLEVPIPGPVEGHVRVIERAEVTVTRDDRKTD